MLEVTQGPSTPEADTMKTKQSKTFLKKTLLFFFFFAMHYAYILLIDMESERML